MEKTQFGSKAHAPPFFEVIKFFQPWKIPSVPAICVTEFTRGDTTAPPRHTAYWQYFLQLLFGTQSANCNDFFSSISEQANNGFKKHRKNSERWGPKKT